MSDPDLAGWARDTLGYTFADPALLTNLSRRRLYYARLYK